MRYDLLDHGYIELKAHMGDDNFLAECARMSTNTVATEDQNKKLVNRLIRDRHTSPIEFGQVVIEAAMPIFVMRQWVRHRTGAFNEFSGRYSEFPDVYYVPAADRVQYQSTFNKQGSAESLPIEDAVYNQQRIIQVSEYCYQQYKEMVDAGVTRELARVVLPVNFYTKVRWTVNLHNLFHFLKLREDPHAQWEVRVYAEALHKMVSELFPAATAAFENHIQNQVVVSQELAQQLAQALTNNINKETDLSSEALDFIRSYKIG